MEALQLKEIIIQNNRIQELLELIGCQKIQDRGEYFQSTRPSGDNPMACQVWKDTLSVKIYTPHEGSGDIFTLVGATYGLNFPDSIRKILALLGIDDTKFVAKKPKKTNIADCLLKYKVKNFTKRDISYYGEEILKDYIQLPNLVWAKEGITPKTQSKYDIGYDMATNRITIPHFSLDSMCGKYIGVMGRTLYKDYDLWGINKYLALVQFPKTYSLYGYLQNYFEIQKANYCVVFESEKSVLKRDSCEDYTALAIGGKDISPYQAKLIMALNVDIVVALDEGVPLRHIREQCRKFSGYRNVYYMYGGLNDKESPADLPDHKYKELFKKKIKYKDE